MRTPNRIALSLLIAVALVGLLLWWSGTSPAAIAETLGRLSPAEYALALGVHAFIYPLRAWRFRVLLGDGAPVVGRLLPVAAAHVLAANVLPAKVGEAALVLYLRRFCGVSGWHGLAVLIVSRILDLAAMTLMLGGACIVVARTAHGEALAWLVPLGGALLAAALLLVFLALRGDRLLGIIEAGVGRSFLTGTALGPRILAVSKRLRQALIEVQAARLARSAPLSLAIWVCIFTFYALLARGLGLADLTPFEAAFGTGLAITAGLLPINGFAGFGAQDAGWVVGFGALGISRELATSTGLAAHVVFLLNIAIFGLIGHVVLALMRPSEVASE